MNIEKLWNSETNGDWKDALNLYYKIPSVKENEELEKSMNNLSSEKIKEMSGEEFYLFLRDEYFVWKFTQKNVLEANKKNLEKYQMNGYDELKKILDDIFTAFNNNPEDTDYLLYKTQKIHGLATAGASGLLALLFPEYYGTVDKFMVEALQKIDSLPEATQIRNIKSESLTISDGVVLEDILRKKSKELNIKFETNEWTPRKIDMILWASDREKGR